MPVLFFLSSILAALGAIMMVTRRNPVYGLLFLLVSFGGAAGVFYTLTATFVAVSQVLVYAGAISVLFLFVLMFVDLKRQGEMMLPKRIDSLSTYDPQAVEASQPKEESQFEFNLGAAVFSLSLLMVLLWVVMDLPEMWDKYKPIAYVPTPEFAGSVANQGGPEHPAGFFGSIREFGQSLMIDYPLHFEVVGLVILVGVMGAVVLGKRLETMKSVEPQVEGDSHHA